MSASPERGQSRRSGPGKAGCRYRNAATSEAIFLTAERSGALPPELDADLLAERYAVFRAHVEASYGFEVTTPYHGPVLHLIASESQSQYMRWNNAATDLTEHVVPGSHYSIWTGDNLLRMAELTRAALAGLRAASQQDARLAH
jgi:hypothetical protein